MTFAPNRGPSQINPNLIPPHMRPYMDFQAGATPAAPGQPQPAAAWRPSFLNTPRVDYPPSPYASAGTTTGGRSGGGGGGFGRGGGGGYSMQFGNAYNPTMFEGPGAYMPGDNADFQRRMSNELMLVNAGVRQPDARQPAQMMASYAAGARSFNPNARRMAAQMGFSGGNGGGAGGGLAGDFQRSFDEARQANEARYRDALEGYVARNQRALDYLGGAGAQEYADLNERYDAQQAAGMQHLIGRGLGNSTLVNTMNMGVDRERNNDIGRLEERLRNQYLTYDTNLSGDTLGFMERRSDTYPNYDQLIQLAQLQGQGGINGTAYAGGQPRAYQVSMAAPGGGTYFYAPQQARAGGVPLRNIEGAMANMRMTPQQIRAELIRRNRGDLWQHEGVDRNIALS